jgi:excinuclease UvrABC ATPase subunit
LRKNFKKLDEGCYGSSDMSGDSIDALTVNNNNNKLLQNKINYFGIYNLNSTTKTCLIDADESVSSNDSAIQTTILNEKQKQAFIFDYNSKHLQQQQQQCNYQLERFEKLYYDDNDNNVNLSVTKHLNRCPQVRGSFV